MNPLKLQKRLENLIFLEFSSGQFTCSRLKTSRSNGGIFASPELVSIESDGLNNGKFSNLEKARQRLNRLLERAEAQFGRDIYNVICIVPKPYNLVIERSIQQSFRDGKQLKITQKMVSELEAGIFAEDETKSNEIIGFQRDTYFTGAGEAEDPIEDPINFHSSKIGLKYKAIEMEKRHLKNLIYLCNAAGLKIKSVVEPLTPGCEALNSTETTVKDSTSPSSTPVTPAPISVHLDFGYNVTSILVTKDGNIDKFEHVSLGYKQLTQDLSIGLGKDVETAAKLIHQIGFDGFEHFKSQYPEEADFDSQFYQRIISARISEVARFISEKLSGYKGMIRNGISLSGHKISGLDAVLSHLLGVKVSDFEPRYSDIPVTGNNIIFRVDSKVSRHFYLINTMYAELAKHFEEYQNRPSGFFEQMMTPIKRWLKEMSD